jgi:hypothetical protein
MIPLEPDSLRLALDARLDESAQSWLADARVRVRSNPGAIATVFPAVGRHAGRQPLDPDPAAATVHAWSVDDAARTLLLVELGDGVRAQIEPLYRYGDTAERRGVIRALAFVEIDPSLGVKLVDDALRTNDVGLIAAAMGPFAVAHLDDAAYAQGVLKCAFVGVPLGGLVGSLERTTPELSAMLSRYVLERVAAGRDVPEDVWPLIDRNPPAAELEAIEAELGHTHADRRRAAAAALAARGHRATQTES